MKFDMAIEDIFKLVICCSCGNCCSENILCDNCVISTLKANGLPENLSSQLTGLSKIWPGNGGFKYSEVYDELQKQLKLRKDECSNEGDSSRNCL